MHCYTVSHATNLGYKVTLRLSVKESITGALLADVLKGVRTIKKNVHTHIQTVKLVY